MENKIICIIDMFAQQQTAILPNGEKVKINIDDIGNNLVDFCLSTDSNLIQLYGNQDYLEGIKEQILTTNYSSKNIEVEIINE